MPGPEEPPAFEILEHTADIGLRARGKTLEELFANSARGLLEILGAMGSEGSEEEQIVAESDDRAALLVQFLDEVIYLVDARGARVARVEPMFESPGLVHARVLWSPASAPLEGTELKAATYHQLSLTEGPEGYEATVYFDV